MKSLKLLLSVIAAVFALGAAMTATASALVVLLPTSTAVKNATGKADGSTNPKFETTGGTFVECTSAPAEATEAAGGKPEGSFHIKFQGCKGHQGVLSVGCKGLGEAAETILVLGTWHLWYDSLAPSLGVATVFLLEEVHFECSFFVTLLFKVKGNVVCLDLAPETSSTVHLFHCTQSKGVADEKTYWDENGTEQKAQLLQSENEGAFGESAELALGETVSAEAVFADNV